MMILTHLNDIAALRLATRIRALGQDCDVVTVEALSFAARRTHRVADHGTTTVIEMQDGRIVDHSLSLRSALVGGPTGSVLNRCVGPPDVAWAKAEASERSYAGAELHAFVLSWLAGLSVPIRNRPTSSSLSGPNPSPLRALSAAGKAGLRIPDFTFDSALACHGQIEQAAVAAAGERGLWQQVVVLDGRAFGPVAPDSVVAGTLRLLSSIGATESLMGANFVVDDDNWWFAGLTSLPELPDTDAFLLELLAVLGSSDAAVEAVAS
jgi:hypothetical protein